MHPILYFPIGIHYIIIVCCNLSTTNAVSISAAVQQLSAIPSIRNVENGYSKTAMFQPLAIKSNVLMRPGKINYGRLVMNNKLGDTSGNQGKTIRLEEAETTVKQYTETLNYELDFRDFDPLTFQDVNNMFLSYLYKCAKLLMMLIEKNQNKLQSSDEPTITSVTAEVEGLHVFFETYNKGFVDRYLKYVTKPKNLSKFKEFQDFMFQKPTNATDDGSITLMIKKPQLVVEHLKELLWVLTEGYVLYLYVSDQQKWSNDVNYDVHSLLAENNNDIILALKINKNEAIEAMRIFFNELNL